MDWLYFAAKTDDGKVLVILRRNGPAIQQLRHDGVWVDGSYWLTRFQDPGYFEEQTLAETQKDAASLGIAWPEDGVTDAAKAKHEALLAAARKSKWARIVPATQQAWLLPARSLAAVKKQIGRG